MTGIILLVDDDITFLETTSELLESFSFDVIKACTTEAAVDILKGIKVQAVLTDFMMPGMSGLRFAQNCVQLQPDAPVVICTGADFGNLTPQYSNIHAVLKKPVSPEVIIETLHRVISGAKSTNLKSITVSAKASTRKP